MAKKKSELPSHEDVKGILRQEKPEFPAFDCSICEDYIENSYGNNPEPLRPLEERCCDFCNCMFVLPARMGVKFDVDDLSEIAFILKKYDLANLLKWWSVFYTTMTRPELANSPRPKPDQQ